MLSHRLDGEGPPLLLLHGFGISFDIWAALAPGLRDHFRLVSVELPGIGASPLPPPGLPYPSAAVEALESLRASLGIPRWSVLSYSSGTRLAEAYLGAHAGHVERAVFLCPALVRPGRARGLNFAARLDAHFPLLGDWVLSGWRIRFLISLLAFNLRPSNRLPDWYGQITSQPVEMLKATLRSLPGGGATPFDLPAEVPALFVWGREDWITATPRRPSARDRLIHATHAAPQTEPRQVAEVILPFLLG